MPPPDMLTMAVVGFAGVLVLVLGELVRWACIHLLKPRPAPALGPKAPIAPQASRATGSFEGVAADPDAARHSAPVSAAMTDLAVT
jgi:hypothetical protein